MKVSFITWDGPQQNYLESLFFPIFEEASGGGCAFSVLQFTWGDRGQMASIEDAARRRGIDYEGTTVIRKPLKPATAAMVVRGAAQVVLHARAKGTDVLMPKQIMPAAMCMMAKPFLGNVKLVFDTDGFMADERVDFGGWDKDGLTYRAFRAVEKKASEAADAVLTRTHRAKDVLLERGDGLGDEDIYPIANAKDAQQFSPGSNEERRAKRKDEAIPISAPWVVYAGSLGPQYHPEAIARFFRAVRSRREDARLTILTGHQEAAREVINAVGVPQDAVDIKRVHPDEVPGYLAAADVGLAFRTPSFSQRGVCPIKVAEYLLCGLPVVATRGVGDIDDQVDEGVGLMLDVDELIGAGLDDAADQFVDDIMKNREEYRRACRERGLEHFGLEQCGAKLREVLEGVVEG